jgi:hypothetical protein
MARHFQPAIAASDDATPAGTIKNEASVASDAKDIPTIRRLIAKQQKDPEWLDDMIYRYDPSLDLEMPGECSLSVQLVR